MPARRRPSSEPKQRRAVGYIRVSAVGGRAGPEYHTKKLQRQSIERVCADRGWELVEIIEDENRSGADRTRPGFVRAMQMIERREVDALAVWKVSRFARSLSQAATDIERLREVGADLAAGEEHFDTSSPEGSLMLHLLLSFAEYERSVLNEGWEAIKGRVVQTRGATLGHAPLGYRHKEGGGGVLEVVPKEAEVVRELFRRRLAGDTVGQLARYLDQVMPREKTVWDTRAVRRILARRAYLGEARWREEIHSSAHEPIISRDDFQRVQRIEDKGHAPRSEKRRFPLTGILRCSGCAGSMSGSVSKQRDGTPRPEYMCSHRAKGCARPVTISAEPVESHLLTLLDEVMAETAFEASAPRDPAVRQLADDLADAEAMISDLASLKMRRALGDDWEAAITQARAEKVEIQRAYERATRRSGISALASSWDDLDEEDRMLALRDALQGVVVAPAKRGRPPVERLTVVWADDGDADAMAS